MARKKWLVVGLGNPGPKYERDRHNAGFQVVDEMARRWGSRWRESNFKGLFNLIEFENGDIWLFKPLTYMNLSGEAVAPFARKKGLSLDSMLVIHDELNLPLGRLLFRKGGSEGGHNGLRSLTKHLGSRDYIRLRFGIGRPEDRSIAVTDYVLSPPRPEEFELWNESVRVAAEMAYSCCTEGLAKAMQRWHTKIGSQGIVRKQ